MKVFKKIIIIFLFINICILCLYNKNIKINAITYSDNLKASYNYLSTKRSLDTSYSHYETDLGETTYNDATSPQQVHVFQTQVTNNSKVVTWAVISDSGTLARATLPQIASDYEDNHPDYEVIGGINGDQFTLGFGTNMGATGKDFYNTQPYYPMIADYEGWFIVTGMPVNSSGNFCLIYNDGRTNSIEYVSTNLNYGTARVKGMYLYIIDENNNRLQKFEVNKYNETPRTNETSLFTSFYNDKGEFPDITITEKNLFVIRSAERAYPNNSIEYSSYKGDDGQNAFFGKGYITEVTNIATIGYGDFAISTNDENLINSLAKGTRILVQYEFDNGYSDVESAIGFHTVHRINSQDKEMNSGDSYNNRPYPRSIIGQKENGDIVLIAIDGIQANKGYTGANFYEINAILKNYGCIEGYQMDGGGSVTAIIKNDNGGFDVVNSPSDGSTRRVFNAVLIVERRQPSGYLSINNINNDNISFDININDYNNTISSRKLFINNQMYDLNNDTIDINLERNKEYNYTLYIEVTDENQEQRTIEINNQIYVPKFTPTLISCIKDIDEENITFNFDILDLDNAITKIYILVNGVRYDTNTNSILVSDISNEDNNTIYLKIEYNNGKENKTITIIHPESKALQFASEILNKSKEEINETKVFK